MIRRHPGRHSLAAAASCVLTTTVAGCGAAGDDGDLATDLTPAVQYCLTAPNDAWYDVRHSAIGRYDDNGRCRLHPDMPSVG